MRAKEIKLTLDMMDNYLEHIDADDSNFDLFKFVRLLQDSVLEQESLVISNTGEFYWHLVEYRDTLNKDN